MFGPIQRLRVCGSICPCFESNEEHALRVADLLLQSVPIRWYRKLRVAPYSVGGDTLMSATEDVVGGTWCGSSQIPAAARKPTEQPTMTQYVGIDASLDVVDTRQGPALLVSSNGYSFVDDDDDDVGTNRNGTKLEKMSKTILLKDIRMASRGTAATWDGMGLGQAVGNKGIIIYSKKDKLVEESGGGGVDAAMKMFLVMQVMPGSKLSLSRDEAMKHLNTLISWDRAGPIEMEEPVEDTMVSSTNYQKMEDTTITTSDSKAIVKRDSGPPRLSAREIAAAPEID